MLVILTEEQIIPLVTVCRCCLLADGEGQPRWQEGKLRCGHQVGKTSLTQTDQYECTMGFRIVKVE